MITACLLLLISSVIGYALLLIIHRQLSVWQRLSLSSPIGLSLLSFIIFIISITYPEIYSARQLHWLLLAGVAVSVVTLRVLRKQLLADLAQIKHIRRKLDLERSIVLGSIVLTTLFVFVLNAAWGPYDWDVMTLYDFRGRVLARDHSLDQLLDMSAGDADRYTYYYSYPMMTSIVHALYYVLGSTQVMTFYSLIFFSFNSLTYLELRKVTRHAFIRLAIFGLILFSPLFFTQAQTAYTNFPYTFFFSFGVLYFFEAFRKQKTPLIPALLIACAIWIRYVDPFYYIVALLIATQALVQKKPWFLLCLIPILVVRQTWAWYLTTYVAIHSTLIQVFTPQSLWHTLTQVSLKQLADLPGVVWFVMKIYLQHLGGVTAALLACLALLSPAQRRRYWLPAIWFASTMAMVMVGSFLFSLIYDDWSGIPGSAERMFSSLILILYVMLVQGIDDWFKKT